MIFSTKPFILNFDLVKQSTLNPNNDSETCLILQCKEIPTINRKYFNINYKLNFNDDKLLAILYNFANRTLEKTYTYYTNINYTQDEIINKFKIEINNKEDKLLVHILKKAKFKNDFKIFINKIYIKIKNLFKHKI